VISTRFNENVVVVARLLQAALVEKVCEANCPCNARCGCDSKPGCCENKCTRDGVGAPRIPDWEEVIQDPVFREVVASFDAEQLKTIADFKALSQHISERLTRHRGEQP